jgi:hypothetical protein
MDLQLRSVFEDVSGAARDPQLEPVQFGGGLQRRTSIWWGDLNSYTSFADWQSSSSEDASSINTDPLFVGLVDAPPDFDTEPASPTVGAGSTSVSCNAGWCDPNGSSPDSIYGSTDYVGNPRTIGSKIDIGAYENTGVAIENTLTATLTAGTYTLMPGQSTTLTVTVSANPGAGGVPSGTVNIMLGSTLLSEQTLLPQSAIQSGVSLPLSASQLAPGANTLTAVYSGNSISPCCPVSGPPVAVYPSTASAPITITKER